VPVRILHFEDGFESLDAGIGEEDVDLAEGLGCPGGSVAQGGKIALIELASRPFSTRSLYEPARFVEIAGCGRRHLQRFADWSCDVESHDSSAFTRESYRGCPSEDRKSTRLNSTHAN